MTGAVLTGLGLGEAVSRTDVPTDNAAVTTHSAVLQDSGWLSEAYWKRRRLKKLNANNFAPGRNQLGFNPFSTQSAPRAVRQHRTGTSTGGNYRTVCVRLCDGYYFPISFSTTRDRFAIDEQACRSKCSGNARLYIYSNSDGSPETMKDRRGRPYSNLETAFLYRTTYNKSCQCKPDPWSQEAKQRHAMYATKAWQKKAQRLARQERRNARWVIRQARSTSRINRAVQPVADIATNLSTGSIPVAATAQALFPAVAPRPAPRRPTYSQRRMSLGGQAPKVQRQPTRPRQVLRSRKSWKSKVYSLGD